MPRKLLITFKRQVDAKRVFVDMRHAVTGYLIKQPAPPEKRS